MSANCHKTMKKEERDDGTFQEFGHLAKSDRFQEQEMVQTGVQQEREAIYCSICLDLLMDPVTITCGHNCCMNCIQTHWDTENEERIYSCPLCKNTLRWRSHLMKSTMLADPLQKLKNNGLQAAPVDQCYAGPEDVSCDACTGWKLKAATSCLDCLASYCVKHLQRHYKSPTFKKHKLIGPNKNLQYICYRHNKVMKMFCRTDQQCVCSLCSVDKHKGHKIVSAAAERTERQREFYLSEQESLQRLEALKKDVEVLEQHVEFVNRSADKAVQDSEIFTEPILLMKKRSSDVKEQIRSKQKTEVSRVKELQEKLQLEITDLKRKITQQQQLTHTKDHIHFLLNYRSLSANSPSRHSSSITVHPLSYYDDVTAVVSKVIGQLQDALTPVDVLLPQPEPKTRAEFLQYSQEITLDPNTANTELLLSEGDKKVTVMEEKQSYSSHPDRFTDWPQVLSKESLNGRCYWEVERRGEVCVAVTYKNICRQGDSDECRVGYNDTSWALDCYHNRCDFVHNRIRTKVQNGVSSRVGVYLDNSGGILSFYSVSDTMTLLCRVKTTFLQPLFAGVGFFDFGSTAELCKVERETFCCLICHNLQTDPVTISCGHKYCIKCIKTHWDTEDEKRLYSCPQCRKTFRPRAERMKNPMSADSVKRNGLQTAPADQRNFSRS